MEKSRDDEPKLIKTKQLEDSDGVLPTSFKDLRKTVDIGTLLSDAGIYSLAAVCALALNELFDDEWDRSFNHHCIKLLLEHLKLPKQVESVMISLVDGQASQTPDAYIDLLLNEPGLQGNALPVVQDLVLLGVHKGKYDARMRVLIRHVAWLLMVPQHLVDLYEESVVECLSDETITLSEEQQKEVDKRQRKKRLKRYALIGLATVGGGTILGLTGGLAAPLIGAGVGSFLGGATAAAIGSSAGIAIIGSLFGVAGAGLTGFKMKKRVGEIEEFAFGFLSPEPEDDIESETDSVGTPSEKEVSTSEKKDSLAPTVQQLHITIAISGWLTDERDDNFTRPWRTMLSSREQYYLRYESTYLLELGKAMELVLSFAVSMAAQEALKYTILSGLISAVTWPASLMTLASVIDNPWGVCCRRSAEVGKQLAEVLLAREQGQRPVTLIGFSLGARVIYYCLREMSQRKDCEGIIEDAILLGTPVSGSPKDWDKLMRVVSGKIINGYCKSDWLLKFLYRTLSISNDVAGLQPIECKNRRMCNVNLSEIVSGHSEYPEKIGAILKVIGVRTHEDASELEAKLTKSSSDLPGGSPTRRRQSASLLALRPSKSDNTIHSQPSAPLECVREQPTVSISSERVELAEEALVSGNNSKSSVVTQEETLIKITATDKITVEEMCDVVKERLTCE